MSDAEQQVPRLLGELKGEAWRQATRAILKHLGRPLRRPERQTRPWEQELLAAAEAGILKAARKRGGTPPSPGQVAVSLKSLAIFAYIISSI